MQIKKVIDLWKRLLTQTLYICFTQKSWYSFFTHPGVCRNMNECMSKYKHHFSHRSSGGSRIFEGGWLSWQNNNWTNGYKVASVIVLFLLNFNLWTTLKRGVASHPVHPFWICHWKAIPPIAPQALNGILVTEAHKSSLIKDGVVCSIHCQMFY